MRRQMRRQVMGTGKTEKIQQFKSSIYVTHGFIVVVV